MLGGRTVPAGFLPCDGSRIRGFAYPSLAAALGYRQGSWEWLDFALPDLRGRVVVGAGTGAGLPPVALAQSFGSNDVPTTASTGGTILTNGPALAPVAGYPLSNASPTLAVQYAICFSGYVPGGES